MSDPGLNNPQRRLFFKKSLFGTALAAAALSGFASSLLGRQKDSVVSVLTDAATVITDASRANHFRLATTRHFRLMNPLNGVDGQRVVWEIIQDGSGERYMTLDDKFVLGTDLSRAALSTTPYKRDFLTAIYNQPEDKWHVVAFIKGY